MSKLYQAVTKGAVTSTIIDIEESLSSSEHGRSLILMMQIRKRINQHTYLIISSIDRMDKPNRTQTENNDDFNGHDQEELLNEEIAEHSQEEVIQEQAEIYLTDPHKFMRFCQGDKKIKIMDECNPILNNVYLKDISLHKKGPLEDKIYSKNSSYYCNIRRGNTLCQIYDEKQQEQQLFMCRRGMKKFYDLEPDYLKLNKKLTHQHERFQARIFKELNEFIEKMEKNGNLKVHLYGLFKENGQHCQISFVKELGYWLFASKNVAILARSQEDLIQHYQKQRFYWAKLIGHQFFKIISKFSQEQKYELVRDLEGKTLLGEYCGHEEHQHITKYAKVEIIFYALVETNGKDHCLPVSQCQLFLSKYGLTMSRMDKIEGLNEKNKIYLSMYQMLKGVASGHMIEQGEGSVMYIVGEDEKGQRTLGMCKLKTCQYLIYRKMREMIKIYFAKKGATANSLQKFKFQIKCLCDNYFDPPRPLQYYEEVAARAFAEVKKNGEYFGQNEFRYKFVTFLQRIEKKTKEQIQKKTNTNSDKEVRRILVIAPPFLIEESSLIDEICKRLQIQVEYSYRQSSNEKLAKTTLHILHMVPRLNLEELPSNVSIVTYEPGNDHLAKSISQLELIQDIKKSHLISFIKSEDKKKTIELLIKKVQNFHSACTEKNQTKLGQQTSINIKRVQRFQDLLKVIQGDAQKNQNAQSQEKQQQKLVLHTQGEKHVIFVVITLLIPGSGKTCLVEAIEKEYPNLNLEVVSSDKIRQKVMEKYKSKRKGHEIEIQESYAATKKKGLEKYRQAVVQAIGLEPPAENKIVFIDRVFCPTTVVQNLKQMRKDWTKFIIVTQNEKAVKLNDYIYPHSLTYLLGCIKRSLQRSEHQTLSQKPNEIVRVILKFYQMYRGFGYLKFCKQLENSNLQYQLLPLEFLKQSEEAENLFLKKKIEECLRGISPGHQPPESPLYNELIQMIYKYKQHFEDEEDEMKKEEMLRKNAEKVIKICLY